MASQEQKRRAFMTLVGLLFGFAALEVWKTYGPTVRDQMTSVEWFSITAGILIIVLPFLLANIAQAIITAWRTSGNNSPSALFEEAVLEKIEISDKLAERRYNDLHRRVNHDERAMLEGRLHVLWGLSEVWNQLEKAGDGDQPWAKDPDDPDKEELQWVQTYSYREIRKIGQRLRELDQERIRQERETPEPLE